jgi:hypothetical protein
MITRSTIGRQKRRRKRQRAFALKETRQTESHPQAYAYMCLHAAHATPSAVNRFFCSIPRIGVSFVFCPSFSGLLMMSCTNPNLSADFFCGYGGDAIESNGFLVWVWVWCNWVERISFVGVGVGVGVMQLMQLSQHMWVCGWWAVL